MISATQEYNSTTLVIFFEIVDNTYIGIQKNECQHKVFNCSMSKVSLNPG
jgi:hypothetical protein